MFTKEALSKGLQLHKTSNYINIMGLRGQVSAQTNKIVKFVLTDISENLYL